MVVEEAGWNRQARLSTTNTEGRTVTRTASLPVSLCGISSTDLGYATQSTFNSGITTKERKETEPAVVDDQGGKLSVQPFGGDGPHVEGANTPDASAPLTSTPKRGDDRLTYGLSSQTAGYGMHQTGDLGASGK